MKFVSRLPSIAGRSLAVFAGTLLAPLASALERKDLTNDTARGRDITDVFNRVDDIQQQGATLTINLAALAGLVIIIISIFALRRASIEERERPAGAMVGLAVGGALAGVSTILYLMRNSMLGV